MNSNYNSLTEIETVEVLWKQRPGRQMGNEGVTEEKPILYHFEGGRAPRIALRKESQQEHKQVAAQVEDPCGMDYEFSRTW